MRCAAYEVVEHSGGALLRSQPGRAGQGRLAGLLTLREIPIATGPTWAVVVRRMARATMCSPPPRFAGLEDAMEEDANRVAAKVSTALVCVQNSLGH